MKPLALGTWAIRAASVGASLRDWRDLLAWCQRFGFVHLEVRHELAPSLLTRELVHAYGAQVEVYEALPNASSDREAITRAAALGAQFFVVTTQPQEVNTWLSEWRQVRSLVADHGMRALWCPRQGLACMAVPFEALADELAAIDIGLVWDTWEAARLHLDLQRNVQHIAHLRFADGDPHGRTALGSGDLDLRSQLGALRSKLNALAYWGIDFDGCLNAVREAKKATGYLRELVR